MKNLSKTIEVDKISDKVLGTTMTNHTNLQFIYKKVSNAFAKNIPNIGFELSADEITKIVCNFVENIYPSMPNSLKDHKGSTQFGGLLVLFLCANILKPEIVIESGVFIGTSLYLFSRACPNAQILAFDINLKNLKVRPNNCKFYEDDWSTFEESKLKKSANKIAFFDDHINNARRLIECAERGVQYAIFDDSPHIGNLCKYRYPGVPTVPMILDSDLCGGETFEWYHEKTKKKLKYTVDIEEIYKAREIIASAISLDQFSDTVGLKAGDKWIVKLKQA